ncbi:hypothetical protein J6590_052595 [Homalodisca vitripennis]|nr:hypothetical protein J6590_052595 [Homalodisca vitripennis]
MGVAMAGRSKTLDFELEIAMSPREFPVKLLVKRDPAPTSARNYTCGRTARRGVTLDRSPPLTHSSPTVVVPPLLWCC